MYRIHKLHKNPHAESLLPGYSLARRPERQVRRRPFRIFSACQHSSRVIPTWNGNLRISSAGGWTGRDRIWYGVHNTDDKNGRR
ncbi:hypothetical protein VTN00DRAFT_3828 [Thermoascus crustaceus]|uniref:uncharacterized protein n=1 Tax=Thermoascus crustaceus TaxID=5088 RepID=UPI003743A630